MIWRLIIQHQYSVVTVRETSNRNYMVEWRSDWSISQSVSRNMSPNMGGCSHLYNAFLYGAMFRFSYVLLQLLYILSSHAVFNKHIAPSHSGTTSRFLSCCLSTQYYYKATIIRWHLLSPSLSSLCYHCFCFLPFLVSTFLMQSILNSYTHTPS